MEFSRTNNAANIQGDMRSCNEDFQVDEIPDFSPTGEGEHVCLKVRKTGQNTEWVGKQFADIAGIARRDVSYAGLKDRHAVTTQWFSIWLPGKAAPNWAEHLPDSIDVLEEVRHNRKVRIGTLKGNRFKLVLRNCQGDKESLEHAISAIKELGVPNYFGQQRFGHEFHNIQRALLWFSGEIKPKARHQKSMYLSAARSLIYNLSLSHRVESGNWNQAIDGDVYQLSGTKSCFFEALDRTIERRVSEFDLHPTGPMWGAGELASQGKVREAEEATSADQALLSQGLEKHGLKQERRSLRMMVEAFNHSWVDDQTLEISFCLPPGSYATSVLRELGQFKDIAELSRLKPD